MAKRKRSVIPAHHIIGFKSFELGRALLRPETVPEIAAALGARFQQIKQAGVIQARCNQIRAWDSPGRSTWEDDLAGDDRYVFLSVGSRYDDQVEGIAFGWVFDAEALIGRGAILGKFDLAADYTEIIGGVAEEVAATLPRLPRISDQELDEFMEKMCEGEGAEMRQHISNNSTNPELELLDALGDGNADYPGHVEAVATVKQRVAVLHRETRLSGEEALAYLRQ